MLLLEVVIEMPVCTHDRRLVSAGSCRHADAVDEMPGCAAGILHFAPACIIKTHHAHEPC